MIVSPEVEADSKTNILILNSYNPSYVWAAELQQGIIAGLKKHEVLIYQEFMDAKNVSDQQHTQNLYNLYNHKYKDVDLDLIIVTDNYAFDFLLKYRNHLFGHIPVVFTGVNDFNTKVLSNHDNYYGITDDINIEQTVDLALDLHPQATELVAFFSDSITGYKFRNIFTEASLNYKVPTTIYTVQNIAEVKEKLKNISENSIIFSGLVLDDKAGNVLPVKESIAEISSSTTKPIYSFWRFYLGSGIVGGNLLCAKTKGETTADLAWRVLEGTVKDKTIVKERFSKYMFDYQELKRLGIKQEQLPKDSQIVNQPNSFYYQYHEIIWAAVIVFLLLLSLIGILVFYIKKYRAAIIKLDDIFSKTHLVFWSLDLKRNKLLDISNSCYEVYGYRQTDFFANPNLLDQVIKEEDKNLVERRQKEMKEDATLNSINLEYRIAKKDGSVRWVKEHRILFKDLKGDLVRLDGIVIDITERKEVEKDLITYANYDVLTGVYNRRMGLVILERDKQNVMRQGINLTVCFVDINNLKFVNDNYGHDEGDRMIKTVAEVIKSEIRKVDTLIRLGGDEFLISLPNSSKEEAEIIWKRILQQFKKINNSDNFAYNIIVSHGLAQYQETDSEVNTIEKLINLADERMYQDKKRLKNKYSVKKE